MRLPRRPKLKALAESDLIVVLLTGILVAGVLFNAFYLTRLVKKDAEITRTLRTQQADAQARTRAAIVEIVRLTRVQLIEELELHDERVRELLRGIRLEVQDRDGGAVIVVRQVPVVERRTTVEVRSSPSPVPTPRPSPSPQPGKGKGRGRR
jgi:hypothetical protein